MRQAFSCISPTSSLLPARLFFKLMHDDETGRDYFLIEGRPDKNHCGGMNDLNEKDWATKIWDNRKNPKHCPVAAIKQYLSVRADHHRFYLTPRTEKPSEGPW